MASMARSCLFATVFFAFLMGPTRQTKNQKVSQIVLPNAFLIGCSSSRCSQLWQERSPTANAIYPIQVSIDIRDSCPSGILARYDKNVPIEEIQAAIDQEFDKWAFADNSDARVPVKLWRVDSRKFAIQLAPIYKKEEKMTLGDELAQPLRRKKERRSAIVGEQVIYLALAGRKCGD